MAVYKYVAVTSTGKEKKGVLEGDSAQQIRQMLRKEGLVPVEVFRSVREKGKAVVSIIPRHINSTDLSLLTYQMATLLGAGLPIEEALLNIADQADKPHIKDIMLGVHTSVLEGNSMAKSLDLFPGSFPKLYRASVDAGEQSGQLDQVLHQLAGYLEKQQEVQQKVSQALIYPGLLTFVSICIVVFLLTYVVPKIVVVFASTGQELPGLTIALLNISAAVKSYGLYVLIALIAFIITMRQLMKRRSLHKKVQLLILKIPVVGSLFREVNTARFSRTFGMLFAASVPVLDAMRAANSVVKLIPLQDAIETKIKKVREGTQIHRALQETGYFSLLSIRLIASGEMSGSLEDMLKKSADYQDRMVAKKIDMGLALFEPLMILLMGSMVLFIVLAILLPIFEINQLIA